MSIFGVCPLCSTEPEGRDSIHWRCLNSNCPLMNVWFTEEQWKKLSSPESKGTTEKRKPSSAKYFPPLYFTIYPLVAEIAKKHGYALAIHGSMGRDFDLIAIPWVEEAEDPDTMLEAMVRETCGLLRFQAGTRKTEKPHGRRTTNLECGAGAYLDISVMPRTKTVSTGLVSQVN